VRNTSARGSAERAEGILDILRIGGESAYFGEPVTQLEHALQTAALAEAAHAPNALVVAALLHDIGHLLHGLDEAIADRGIDGRHEEVGNRWLGVHFNRAVTEPIRLHVAAKRYLCAAEEGYVDALSPASRESLELQGGPMTPSEVEVFEQTPWAWDALALRRWDDAAKVPGLEVPALDYYRPLLVEQLDW
jgi:gamma-butyrobetaine dioxygenase